MCSDDLPNLVAHLLLRISGWDVVWNTLNWQKTSSSNPPTPEKSDQMIPILPRGKHVFNFTFSLPQSSLPCSFESRFCTIRYYVKVTLDIPYSSPPQGIKYFTIIGPHIDVMDQRYLVSSDWVALIFDLFMCGLKFQNFQPRSSKRTFTENWLKEKPVPT